MNNPLSIVGLLLKAKRPSRLSDMTARKDSFWLGKGYEALTFFGTVLTHTQAEADRMNSHYDTLKNHEMIHLYQARSTHDSWLCFYLLYLWHSLRLLPYNRHVKNAAYRLNPFEMEAYEHMNDLSYTRRHPDGVNGWRRYARMSVEERKTTILGILKTTHHANRHYNRTARDAGGLRQRVDTSPGTEERAGRDMPAQPA